VPKPEIGNNSEFAVAAENLVYILHIP
jgi:hypothetical protein